MTAAASAITNRRVLAIAVPIVMMLVALSVYRLRRGLARAKLSD